MKLVFNKGEVIDLLQDYLIFHKSELLKDANINTSDFSIMLPAGDYAEYATIVAHLNITESEADNKEGK